MPRRQRSRATCRAQGEPGTSAAIWRLELSRRTSSASIAPRSSSSRTACATGSPSSTPASQSRWRLGPGAAVEAEVVAQQQLADAVARAHQIAAQVLARPHQVAQRLLARWSAPGPVQLADHQQPHQPLGVAPVGLDPVLRGRARSCPAPRPRTRPRAPAARARARTRSARPHRPPAPAPAARRRTPPPRSSTPAAAAAQLPRLAVDRRRDASSPRARQSRPSCEPVPCRHPHDCGRRRGHSSTVNPRTSCAGADLYARSGSSRRSGGPAIGSSCRCQPRCLPSVPEPLKAAGGRGRVVAEVVALQPAGEGRGPLRR